jgi:hypothetical protein
MRSLTIRDLKLGLRDLLGDKLEQLRSSKTGRLYEKRLRAKQKAIEAIPDAVGTQTPLVAELAEADVRHDGYGGAIFYLCRAIQAHPTLSHSIKDAAAEVQATFVPQLDVLRAPYADEASAALENRPELKALKAELHAIATPGGGTLHDWVKSFIGAGDAIDKLLRERAKRLATTDNAAAAGPLRGATIGLLGRFRDALGDEVQEEDSALPSDFDARLFAYFDKLNADRERSLRARTPGGAPADAVADGASPAAEPAGGVAPSAASGK